MESNESKIRCFQDVTGVEDPLICSDILGFHDWDIDAAAHSILDGTARQTPTNSICRSSSHWVPTIEQPAPYRQWFPQNQGSGLDSIGSFFDSGRENHSLSIGQAPQDSFWDRGRGDYHQSLSLGQISQDSFFDRGRGDYHYSSSPSQIPQDRFPYRGREDYHISTSLGQTPQENLFERGRSDYHYSSSLGQTPQDNVFDKGRGDYHYGSPLSQTPQDNVFDRGRSDYHHNSSLGQTPQESFSDRGRRDYPCSSSPGQISQQTMDYHGSRDPFVGNGEFNHGGHLNSYGDNSALRDHKKQVGSRSRPESRCAGMMSKIVSLPSSIIGGVSKAVGYGMTVAGEVMSHIGMGRRHGEPQRIQQQPACLDPFPSYVQNDGPSLIPIQSEALAFVISFEQQYGRYHPSFVESNFMDALRRANDECKFLLVYLHHPDHPLTDIFCQNTLCSEFVVQYLDANFVCWGATVNSSEGFHMSKALLAATFPFCALVTSAPHESLAVMQQVEGPAPSEALVEILQRAVEEQGSALMNERLEEEDGILSNRRLREEQDTAYQVALRADQERNRRTQLQSAHVSKTSEDKERKKPAEKESPSQFYGKENAPAADGIQPEKGPNVTQILIRFPNGDRKERRFFCTDKVRSIYKYVDSLGLVAVGSYKLIATFPRREYGSEKMNLTLKEAGLHPQASLYLELSNKQ